MKKIYAFLAAALMSVSMFAAPTKVPTVADLAASYDVANNVVLCLYFDEQICNDVVLAGNYNGWSTTVSDLVKFEPLTNFDGWYVAEFPYQLYGDNSDETPAAKPVQLKTDGSFDWDFQSGDVESWINMDQPNSQIADVSAGYPGEANVTYGSAGAYIYEIAYFKMHNSPCVVVPTHKYTIKLYQPACGDIKPAVAGNFNGWSFTAMSEELDDDFNTVYVLVIEDEEGHGFKFADAVLGWDNEILHLDEESAEWVKFDNNILPVTDKDMEIVFDYSDGAKYKYAQCGADQTEYEVFVTLKAPLYSPKGVDIIGTFDEWNGTQMQAQGNDVFTVTVKATEAQVFKFREAGTWDNEIVLVENPETAAMGDTKFGDVWADKDGGKEIVIDFSDNAVYTWKVPTALENITLDAVQGVRKVVIDGHLYIQKDNAIFSVMGSQVR